MSDPTQQPHGPAYGPQSWGPPPGGPTPWVRPQRPEVPVRRALIWTAFFSLLGVLAAGLFLLLLVFMIYVLIYAMASLIDSETWDFWGEITDSGLVGDLAGPVGVVIVIATVVVFALCAGVLLLLRRADAIRRWAAPLQAITACGIVYLTGSTIAGVLASLPVELWQ